MTFSITSPGPFACQYVKHSENHKDHITYRSVLFLFTLNYYPINPSLNTQKQEKKYLLFTMIWLLIYSQNLPSILEIFRQIFLAFQHFKCDDFFKKLFLKSSIMILYINSWIFL